MVAVFPSPNSGSVEHGMANKRSWFWQQLFSVGIPTVTTHFKPDIVHGGCARYVTHSSQGKMFIYNLSKATHRIIFAENTYLFPIYFDKKSNNTLCCGIPKTFYILEANCRHVRSRLFFLNILLCWYCSA